MDSLPTHDDLCFAVHNKQMTLAWRAAGSEFNKGAFGGPAPLSGSSGAPTPFVAAVDECGRATGASSPSLISQAFAEGTWP
jgi:hypothetical protein